MKPRRTGQDRGIFGTRRERIARVRRDMVHAAGEVNLNHNCCITACFRTDICLEDFDSESETLDLIRSGAIRSTASR